MPAPLFLYGSMSTRLVMVRAQPSLLGQYGTQSGPESEPSPPGLLGLLYAPILPLWLFCFCVVWCTLCAFVMLFVVVCCVQILFLVFCVVLDVVRISCVCALVDVV